MISLLLSAPVFATRLYELICYSFAAILIAIVVYSLYYLVADMVGKKPIVYDSDIADKHSSDDLERDILLELTSRSDDDN